ncbi:MAG: hypothetical protein ABI076_09105 [Acidobacteriaceae bacterium]
MCFAWPQSILLEGAFDDPARGQCPKPVQFIGLDHFNPTPKHLFFPCDQPSRVTAVNEYLRDVVDAAEHSPQHRPRAYSILNLGQVYGHRQQATFGIYLNMPLVAFDLLARGVTASPTFNAVLATCESRIATVGVAFRPRAWRIRSPALKSHLRDA